MGQAVHTRECSSGSGAGHSGSSADRQLGSREPRQRRVEYLIPPMFWPRVDPKSWLPALPGVSCSRKKLNNHPTHRRFIAHKAPQRPKKATENYFYNAARRHNADNPRSLPDSCSCIRKAGSPTLIKIKNWPAGKNYSLILYSLHLLLVAQIQSQVHTALYSRSRKPYTIIDVQNCTWN